MRISDWSSDVCSSDLPGPAKGVVGAFGQMVLRGRPNLLERAEGLRERVGRCDVNADCGGRAKPFNSAFRSGRELISHSADLGRTSLRAGSPEWEQHRAQLIADRVVGGCFIFRQRQQMQRSEGHTSK